MFTTSSSMFFWMTILLHAEKCATFQEYSDETTYLEYVAGYDEELLKNIKIHDSSQEMRMCSNSDKQNTIGDHFIPTYLLNVPKINHRIGCCPVDVVYRDSDFKTGPGLHKLLQNSRTDRVGTLLDIFEDNNAEKKGILLLDSLKSEHKCCQSAFDISLSTLRNSYNNRQFPKVMQTRFQDSKASRCPTVDITNDDYIIFSGDSPKSYFDPQKPHQMPKLSCLQDTKNNNLENENILENLQNYKSSCIKTYKGIKMDSLNDLKINLDPANDKTVKVLLNNRSICVKDGLLILCENDPEYFSILTENLEGNQLLKFKSLYFQKSCINLCLTFDPISLEIFLESCSTTNKSQLFDFYGVIINDDSTLRIIKEAFLENLDEHNKQKHPIHIVNVERAKKMYSQTFGYVLSAIQDMCSQNKS